MTAVSWRRGCGVERVCDDEERSESLLNRYSQEVIRIIFSFHCEKHYCNRRLRLFGHILAVFVSRKIRRCRTTTGRRKAALPEIAKDHHLLQTQTLSLATNRAIQQLPVAQTRLRVLPSEHLGAEVGLLPEREDMSPLKPALFGPHREVLLGKDSLVDDEDPLVEVVAPVASGARSPTGSSALAAPTLKLLIFHASKIFCFCRRKRVLSILTRILFCFSRAMV